MGPNSNNAFFCQVRTGDASLAAPFTSKKPSIVAVVDAVRQGRCVGKLRLVVCRLLRFPFDSGVEKRRVGGTTARLAWRSHESAVGALVRDASTVLVVVTVWKVLCGLAWSC